jgi:hypothetical protein
MYNKEESFKKYCDKYSKEDSKYIVDLEEIAFHVEDVQKGNLIGKSDYNEEIKIIQNSIDNCKIDNIIPYTEYILNHLLPIHENERLKFNLKFY